MSVACTCFRVSVDFETRLGAGPPAEPPLSHPTAPITPNINISIAKKIRRGRGLDIGIDPRLSTSIANRNPPDPPSPSPGTIDAYITGERRIVIPVLFVMVVARVKVAVPPAAIVRGGTRLKTVL